MSLREAGLVLGLSLAASTAFAQRVPTMNECVREWEQNHNRGEVDVCEVHSERRQEYSRVARQARAYVNNEDLPTDTREDYRRVVEVAELGIRCIDAAHERLCNGATAESSPNEAGERLREQQDQARNRLRERNAELRRQLQQVRDLAAALRRRRASRDPPPDLGSAERPSSMGGADANAELGDAQRRMGLDAPDGTHYEDAGDDGVIVDDSQGNVDYRINEDGEAVRAPGDIYEADEITFGEEMIDHGYDPSAGEPAPIGDSDIESGLGVPGDDTSEPWVDPEQREASMDDVQDRAEGEPLPSGDTSELPEVLRFSDPQPDFDFEGAAQVAEPLPSSTEPEFGESYDAAEDGETQGFFQQLAEDGADLLETGSEWLRSTADAAYRLTPWGSVSRNYERASANIDELRGGVDAIQQGGDTSRSYCRLNESVRRTHPAAMGTRSCP